MQSSTLVSFELNVVNEVHDKKSKRNVKFAPDDTETFDENGDLDNTDTDSLESNKSILKSIFSIVVPSIVTLILCEVVL